MRKLSNKVWALLVAALLVGAGVVSGGQAAYAQVNPYGDTSARTFVIGVPVDTYITCAPSQPGETVSLFAVYTYNGESWPPGLTYDSATGHLTGTPNQIGSWTPPVISCLSSADWIWNWGTWPWNVINATTPTPFISATNLNDHYCQIRLVGLLNAVPVTGQTKIRLAEGSAAAELTLRDYAVGEPIDLTLPLDGANLKSSALSNTDIVGYSGDDAPFNCSSHVDVTLTTVSDTSDPSSASTSVTVSSDIPQFTPPPTVQVTNLNDEACEVLVIGSLPVSNDPGTLVASMTNGDAVVSATSMDHAGGTVFSQVVSLNKLAAGDTSDLNNMSDVVLDQGASGFHCGDMIRVTLGYQFHGKPQGTATSDTIFAMAPTVQTPTPGNPAVTLVANNDAICSITVIVNIPQAADADTLVELLVGTDLGVYDLTLNDLTPSVPTAIVLPLNAMDQFTNSYTAGQVQALGVAPKCGDRILSEVTMTSGGAHLTSDLATTDSGLSCGPGKYNSGDFTCTTATIGHFVNSVGSQEQLACPSGTTTLITGATSINDCFKLVTPTISTLKAPKAVKFGSKTTLVTKLSTGGVATVTAVGACTVKVTSIVTKVKNKKVSTPGVAVTAKKVAGNCTLQFSSAGSGLIQGYAKTVKFKVSKTGK
jgi:hypothetical protein